MDQRHLLIMGLMVVLVSGFKQLHEENRIIAYYEHNSFKPFLHVYYNRHFKNSSQFKQFEEIISQLHYDHGDYMDVVFTDCDKDTGLKINMCKQMNKTKDNRQIVGTVPSSEFRRIGDKLIQSPPSSQVLEHSRDRYTYTQLRDFMKALLPNFLKQLNNKDELEDFLLPHYSPKFIAFVRDDQQIPVVFKQIAIAFFLKLDFSVITDLNQQLLPLFDVKNYPSFVIITYNFDQSKHEYHYYPQTEFSESNYFDIKQFVSKFALPEPRNDLVFHKIRMEKQAEVITVESEGQLQQVKQKAHGWIIIVRGDGKIPQQLAQFREKYDRYFSYVNYVSEPFGKVQIYNPSQNLTIPFEQKLEFNSLGYEHFKSNMTVWLSKDMVVLGVVEDYSYVCGVAEKTLFRGHVRCLIISKEGQAELKEFMKIDFKVGFIVRAQNTDKKPNENRETKGVKLMTDNFEQVYNQMDFTTRTKIKQIMDDYLQKPVSQVRGQMTLQQACSHPFKKCLLLVTSLAKQDRTLQQYIKQIAFDYINSFIVYEVDIDSNPEFVKAIGGIKDKKADLIVYNSRIEDSFTKLNRKVTKNLISQFMKANLKNDKRLKRQTHKGLDKIIIRRRLGNEKRNDIQIEVNQQL